MVRPVFEQARLDGHWGNRCGNRQALFLVRSTEQVAFGGFHDQQTRERHSDEEDETGAWHWLETERSAEAKERGAC